MDASRYAAFLPAERRSEVGPGPEETWWSWRDHTVHVARRRSPAAPVRAVVVHGAGAHSTALWPLAALIARQGVDVAAVDLPLYGKTVVPRPEAVRYDDWVELLVDFVRAEAAVDHRPLLLFGASMGGYLACEVAARTGTVAELAVTCLLDPGDWRTRAVLTRFGPLGIAGGPLSRWAPHGLDDRALPMSSVANMSAMSRDEGLSRLCAEDLRGGGARVPLGFLRSYMTFRHCPPEEMTTPVTLVQPARDAWTPAEVCVRLLRRMAGPARMAMLRECGHFPVEEPGLTDLLGTINGMVDRITGTTPPGAG